MKGRMLICLRYSWDIKYNKKKKKESSASKFGYEISMEPAILQLLSAEECALHISTWHNIQKLSLSGKNN